MIVNTTLLGLKNLFYISIKLSKIAIPRENYFDEKKLDIIYKVN